MIGEWCVRDGETFLDLSESPFADEADLVAYVPEEGAGVEVVAPAGFWGHEEWPPLRESRVAEHGGWTTNDDDFSDYTPPLPSQDGWDSAGDVDGEVWS